MGEQVLIVWCTGWKQKVFELKNRAKGFVCGDMFSVYITILSRQWFSPYSGFQHIYTDNGFHLKSRFKKRLSTQTMVFTLNLISWKSYLHRQFIYSIKMLMLMQTVRKSVQTKLSMFGHCQIALTPSYFWTPPINFF